MASGSSALPPRKTSKDTSGVRRSLPKTTLELLVDMGFDKQLSEKVIAAVGDKDIHVAVDWLMSHMEDPTLKESNPREYVVYLCPQGPLNESLLEHWERSECECGWNGVHSHQPHITLTPFFKIQDEKLPQLIDIFSSLTDQCRNSPGYLKLELYTVINFIGLFVPENLHSYLTKIMAEFSSKLKGLDNVDIVTEKKQLHLTLAYQFAQNHYDALNKLSEGIDLSQDVRWEMRLYSRDPRHAQCKVYIVRQNFTATADDEIDLIEGDYMHVEEAYESDDKWLHGTSWLTGCSGMFPMTYCKRTSLMNTWTLHKVINLDRKLECQSAAATVDTSDNSITELYSKVKKRRSICSVVPQNNIGTPKRVLVMRHGERVDFVMGRDWMDKCFTRSGDYRRIDLNLPRHLPRRRNPSDYIGDSPLTEIGQYQAFKTGEALAQAGVIVTQVYSSPSLRCIQTAAHVLKGLNVEVAINVDPIIFEWLQWYPAGIPAWLSADDLVANGYPINRAYKPVYTREKLSQCMCESVMEYYERNTALLASIVTQQNQGDTILVVGHAGSLDCCMRQVRGLDPPVFDHFTSFVSKVPYCSLAMHDKCQTTGQWKLVQSPIFPFTHSSNKGRYWIAADNL